MNRAEAREIENMNPAPDEEDLERFLQPSNMMMAGQTSGGNGDGNQNGTGARQLGPGQALELARSARPVRETVFALSLADRVVNRELTAVNKAARRFSKD